MPYISIFPLPGAPGHWFLALLDWSSNFLVFSISSSWKIPLTSSPKTSTISKFKKRFLLDFSFPWAISCFHCFTYRLFLFYWYNLLSIRILQYFKCSSLLIIILPVSFFLCVCFRHAIMLEAFFKYIAVLHHILDNVFNKCLAAMVLG